MKPILIQHLEGEAIGRFPVWMMRQAGRYLPEYREIRSRHSFWEMVTLPEVAAEVSLQPIRRYPLDAVIFFSDILTLPYSLGIPIELVESIGPVNHRPLASELDFGIFDAFQPSRETRYVGGALRLIREQLPADKALLGFAGAPWTVGCYLIEGKSSKTFEKTLTWMYRDEASLVNSLRTLAGATRKYLDWQIQNGADAVQVFDTWLSHMPREFFAKHYLGLLNEIFNSLPVPVVFFAQKAHHLIDLFVELNANVLSVDSLVSLERVDQLTRGKFSLQGNLDPMVLFSDVPTVRRRTRALVETARRLSRPAILNLGHGVLPGTPLESVEAFVQEASTLWV